jgi:hypothetical protein
MTSFNCKCAERKKPIRERNWQVLQYKSRCSAFDGYKVMISDFSSICCKSCGAAGRTKAAYVDTIYYSQRSPI